MSQNEPVDLASIKRKKMVLLVGIMAGIMGVSLTAVWISSSDKKTSMIPTNSKKIPTTSIASPGEQIRPEDVWRAMSEAQIKNLESSKKESDEKLKRLTEDFEKFKKEGDKGTRPVKEGSDDKGKRSADAHVPPLPPLHQAGAAPPTGVAVGPERYSPNGMAARPGQPAAKQNAVPTTGIMTVNFSNVATDATKGFANGVTGKDKKKERRTVDHYIPSGSFTPAILLGGIDAASGGSAQHNPQPVVAQLVDTAILPNKYRYDVKSCFVVGAGYGDISAERAYVRLESLSCVLRDHTVVDVQVKGALFDETGKAGLRGRVVTKTGQILANALLAGIASGIGKAFQQTAQVQSISPLGTTSTIDSGKIGQAALGSGISTSMDKLADYYIKLADQVFPIIEVDSGRKVDVVFTQGVDLGKFDAQQADVVPSSAPSATPNISKQTSVRNVGYPIKENR